MSALVRWCWDAGPPSLRAYLGVALLLRLPAVAFSRGYEFLDHQFQYVDPAWHLATGASWNRTWEWIEGIRSWAYPGFLAGTFRGLQALGLRDPELLMMGVRFVHALVSLLPLAALWLVIVRWRPMEPARPVLLLAASYFLIVYCGVQPNGLAFASGLSLAAVLFLHGPGALWPLLSGLCLGVAFACRVQEALFGPVLFAAALFERRVRPAILFALGAAIPVLGQGLLDLWTWGRFLHSPLRYVEMNFFLGRSAQFGTAPPWAYAVMAAGFFWMVFPSAWRWFALGSRSLPVPLAAAIFYLLVHSTVERKSFRFVAPAFAMLAVVYFAGMVRDRAADRWTTLHRRVYLTSHVLVAFFFTFAYLHRGPIEAAKLLRARADFSERLCIIDGPETAVGGHYYLGRPRLRVDAIARSDLPVHLTDPTLPSPLYLLVVGHALDPRKVFPGWELDQIGKTRDWPDLKQRHRRFLIRAVRRSS